MCASGHTGADGDRRAPGGVAALGEVERHHGLAVAGRERVAGAQDERDEQCESRRRSGRSGQQLGRPGRTATRLGHRRHAEAVTSAGAAGPPGVTVREAVVTLRRRGEQVRRVVRQPVADALAGYVGAVDRDPVTDAPSSRASRPGRARRRPRRSRPVPGGVDGHGASSRQAIRVTGSPPCPSLVEASAYARRRGGDASPPSPASADAATAHRSSASAVEVVEAARRAGPSGTSARSMTWSSVTAVDADHDPGVAVDGEVAERVGAGAGADSTAPQQGGQQTQQSAQRSSRPSGSSSCLQVSEGRRPAASVQRRRPRVGR